MVFSKKIIWFIRLLKLIRGETQSYDHDHPSTVFQILHMVISKPAIRHCSTTRRYMRQAT